MPPHEAIASKFRLRRSHSGLYVTMQQTIILPILYWMPSSVARFITLRNACSSLCQSPISW